ncbi:glycosyltransferase family protein 64 C3-like [Lycium ferocissimum]|uniref:glycosyltransferase family protein 64 C3-like n=1 Tax=Lycium ferocissimum TaxID=112874 RepID=UPI002815E363|nr:glycosyltransferase family protein 64 C3-like [Lycium ferocissimum]
MNNQIISSYGIIILSMPLFVISLRTCNSPPVNPQTLQTDQLTVLINGYSEHRIPLLQSIAATYAAASSVAAVVILWSNPTTPPQILSDLTKSLATSSTPISILRQRSSSLNLRFYPHKSITTRAVLICDDDIEPDPDSIDFAFNVWRSDPDRLVGFFVRSHSYDLSQKSWIYTMENNKYSIALTKFMILNLRRKNYNNVSILYKVFKRCLYTNISVNKFKISFLNKIWMILKLQYLHEYTCNKEYEKLRAKVEEKNNCEDILMNFVVAEEVKKGPILVGAKRVRDWGDARNEGGEMEKMKEREVGLSSRKREHRKRRGECIAEFHRLLGKMPLRYSYGKVVDSIGEQGLCEKGGKLVYCDRQIFR